MTSGIKESTISDAIPDVAPLDLGQWFSLVIMIIFGIGLWLKGTANAIHVMVALIWSPIALVLGLIPQTSWVTGLWMREFAGRLAGVVLAASAVAVGFSLAFTHGSVLLYTGIAGAFWAAGDLLDWLARSPTSNATGLAGMATRMGMGWIGGGTGAVSAGAQAAGMRSLGRGCRQSHRIFLQLRLTGVVKCQ